MITLKVQYTTQVSIAAVRHIVWHFAVWVVTHTWITFISPIASKLQLLWLSFWPIWHVWLFISDYILHGIYHTKNLLTRIFQNIKHSRKARGPDFGDRCWCKVLVVANSLSSHEFWPVSVNFQPKTVVVLLKVSGAVRDCLRVVLSACEKRQMLVKIAQKFCWAWLQLGLHELFKLMKTFSLRCAKYLKSFNCMKTQR